MRHEATPSLVDKMDGIALTIADDLNSGASAEQLLAKLDENGLGTEQSTKLISKLWHEVKHPLAVFPGAPIAVSHGVPLAPPRDDDHAPADAAASAAAVAAAADGVPPMAMAEHATYSAYTTSSTQSHGGRLHGRLRRPRAADLVAGCGAGVGHAGAAARGADDGGKEGAHGHRPWPQHLYVGGDATAAEGCGRGANCYSEAQSMFLDISDALWRPAPSQHPAPIQRAAPGVQPAPGAKRSASQPAPSAGRWASRHSAPSLTAAQPAA